MENDILLSFGGEVKALDNNGRVGGYLIRYSDAAAKDLDNEYFTAETYYGPQYGDGVECLFHHGEPVPALRYVKDATPEAIKALNALANRTFSPLKTRRDPVGIFAETVLNMEDEYEKFIFSRVQKKKIGWSSGAAGHRVKKNKDGQITCWPIAEGSLTPQPAEPLNRLVTMKAAEALKFVDLYDEDDDAGALPAPSVKSPKTLAERLTLFIEDRIEDGHSREDTVKRLARESMLDDEQIEGILAGKITPSNAKLKAFARVLKVPFEQLKALRVERRSIKDMFTEALAENTPSSWQLDSAYRDVCRDLAMGAKGTAAAGAEFDFKGPLHEAITAYMGALEDLTANQIQEYIDSAEDDPFYLKSIVNFTDELVASASLEVDDHCSLAVSAFKSLVARFKQFHGTRVKAGRVLSEKNRSRLAKLVEQMSAAVTECQSLLDETKPMADDMAKNAALARNLLLRQERRQQLGA